MNTLEQNINDLILWVKTTATATQGFLTEQTPLYIKEYVKWFFWENAVQAAIGWIGAFVLAGIAISAVKFGYKLCKSKSDDGEICGVIIIVFTVIASCGAFPLLTLHSTQHSLNAIKAVVAPRVVIVDELANKIKK
jgi:hypothetical protein